MITHTVYLLGSGKTYTMSGIYQRASEQLFAYLKVQYSAHTLDDIVCTYVFHTLILNLTIKEKINMPFPYYFRHSTTHSKPRVRSRLLLPKHEAKK